MLTLCQGHMLAVAHRWGRTGCHCQFLRYTSQYWQRAVGILLSTVRSHEWFAGTCRVRKGTRAFHLHLRNRLLQPSDPTVVNDRASGPASMSVRASVGLARPRYTVP